jgi:hypothetical protein
MLSIEEVRRRKTPVTRMVTIVVDGEWGAKYQQLQVQIARLMEMGMDALGSSEWGQLSDELERMSKEAPEHTVELHVKAISNDRYERILRAHPITAEQRAAAKRAGDNNPRPWNPDTFPPALLSACLVDPETGERWAGEADVYELWHDEDNGWSTAELAALFDAAIEVCLTRPVVSTG